MECARDGGGGGGLGQADMTHFFIRNTVQYSKLLYKFGHPVYIIFDKDEDSLTMDKKMTWDNPYNLSSYRWKLCIQEVLPHSTQ